MQKENFLPDFYNANSVFQNTAPFVLFVDMNSFFASCEQQDNFYLRGRPVGICVYTGKTGCVIAPSIEAKKSGVKTGMRLNEAVKVCPDLIPVETHPTRYRKYHVQIINVLKKYSEDVIPKSIDEAIVNLQSYKMIYKNVMEVAKNIKKDIQTEVGDWLKCSIGVAPNAFLAKLASDIQKPDGLVLITPENIDEVLSKLALTDLPGIGSNMSMRLQLGGIQSPLDIRYASPEKLKRVCKGIVGLHWHYRLNFCEVDMDYKKKYKSMQALRSISREQRSAVENLNEILTSLCMTLEKRMMRQKIFAKEISVTVMYETNGWNDHIKLNAPLQDGAALLTLVRERIRRFEKIQCCEPIINTNVRRLGVGVYNFVPDEMIQCQLFENNLQKDKLRKIMFDIKSEYGYTRLMRATELNENKAYKDVIGFGSVKDLETFSYNPDELDKLQRDFQFDYAAMPVEDNEIEIKENFENTFYE